MSQIRACILSVAGQSLTPDERRLLAGVNPFGVILMGRSCGNPQQVKALVDEIHTATGRQTLIFIDQEGGRVRRLKPPAWPDFPAPKVYGDLFDRNPEAGLELAWLGHRLMAAELAPMGIRADCAPVVDLNHPGMHQIVGDRSMGSTPVKVSALARRALEGLADGGVAGVIKHLPGHGRARVDSHESLPVVEEGEGLIAEDIAAFQPLKDAPMAMTAHLAYPVLDGQTPATHSPKIISEVIRGSIGFDGLLMTDDLGMNALGGSLADRARKAFAAGCDIALHCSGFLKEPHAILAEMREVADASPVLSGIAIARADDAESATKHMKPFDRAAGWERFRELVASAGNAAA